MRDLITEFEESRRRVTAGVLGDGDAHVVELRRRLRAPADDVWDACTDPVRVQRWFLPLSGDLRPGGRYQLEGNAGGSILVCERPHRLALSWEFGDMSPGLVTLELVEADDGSTELVLRHTVADDGHWAQYGPGAVGVGWDLPLAVLAVLVAGGEPPTGAEFMTDPRTPGLMRSSAEAWGDAHRDSGADPGVARDAAAQTSAAYAPQG